MFNHTATTAALTAALTFSAFAGSTDNQAPEADARRAPSINNEHAGNGSTSGSSFGDQASKSAPGLGDQVRVREGSTSRTIRPHREAPAPSFDHESPAHAWETATFGDERGPGIGDEAPGANDGTSGGPFGNEWEKALGMPGFGDQARVPRGTTERAAGPRDADHEGPMGDEYMGDNEAPAIDPGQRDPADHDVRDINADGHIDFMDLVELLAAWGRHDGPADLTGDGVVSTRDLFQLLSGMTTMYAPDTTGETGSEGTAPTRNFKRAAGRQVIDFGS